MALVMSVSIGRGAACGFLAALGLAASRSIHVVASGLGLSAMFAAYPALFNVMSWVGATYLLWLAWRLVASASNAESPAVAGNARASAIWQGFSTNLLNPKAFMFCAIFLPQFVSPSQSNILAQYAVLGVILVAMGFLFDAGYVLVSRALARRRNPDQGIHPILRLLFAGLFTLTAIRLIAG